MHRRAHGFRNEDPRRHTTEEGKGRNPVFAFIPTAETKAPYARVEEGRSAGEERRPRPPLSSCAEAHEQKCTKRAKLPSSTPQTLCPKKGAGVKRHPPPLLGTTPRSRWDPFLPEKRRKTEFAALPREGHAQNATQRRALTHPRQKKQTKSLQFCQRGGALSLPVST